ncbi:MAG: VanZ family protein [Actinophytocola sp.]|uniref:VanZ family protein n=1 Tax=Actinophytocola sp. TaxID=1872138 RepID=UPI003C73087C
MTQLARAFGNSISVTIAFLLAVALIGAWVATSRNEHSRLSRTLQACALILSIIAVLYITLGTRLGYSSRDATVSLVPMADTLHALTGPTTASATIFGIIGNIALFAPLGFSLSLTAVRTSRRVSTTLITATLLSISVESAQFILGQGGVVAVDDVLLNVAGAAAGWVAHGWAGRSRRTDPSASLRNYG